MTAAVSRFQPLGLSPAFPGNTFSLHRLKTAFSSPSSSRPNSTSTMSPLSPPRSSSDFSPAPSDSSLFSTASDSSTSSRFKVARLRQMIMLRHRPSTLELSLQEEKKDFGKDALEMFEPRPQTLGCSKAHETLLGKTERPVVVGIFEVLEGAA